MALSERPKPHDPYVRMKPLLSATVGLHILRPDER